jgi:hypothetical protein
MRPAGVSPLIAATTVCGIRIGGATAMGPAGVRMLIIATTVYVASIGLCHCHWASVCEPTMSSYIILRGIPCMRTADVSSSCPHWHLHWGVLMGWGRASRCL